MTNKLLFYVAVALVVAAVLLVREALRDKVFAKKRTCKGNHFWRTIAEPYARQCRICGRTEFRPDPHGAFPDGLLEYFAYIESLSPQERRTKPAPDMCHCGAQMDFQIDATLGEIWLCPVCTSWKKTAKQDALDTKAITQRMNEKRSTHER